MTNTKTEEIHIAAPFGQIYAKRWLPAASTSMVPVVLLHDSLGCVGLWKDFPETLADYLKRPVVAYDRLGFGQSDARTQPPSLDFIEEEATRYFPQIKQALGLKEYMLIGYSVGGSMAANIACRDNDCVAMVSISAQPYVEERTLEGIQDAKRMFDKPGQIQRLQKWHADKALWVLHAWTDTWMAPEYRDWNLKSVLQRVTCPTLIVHGGQDEFGSLAFPDYIAQLVAGSHQLLIFDDCGHMPHKEKADDLLAALSDFLI